jgi:Flp pilus assembly protein TadG
MDAPDPTSSGRRDERGQALVEFALALVLFFATLLGIIQFGVAVFRYNILSDLAQEGARWAAVRGATSGSMQASQADVQTFVRSRSLNINVSVTTSVAPSSLTAGNVIQVTVQHTFTPFTRLLPLGTVTLQSTAQMIMAR